MPTETFTLQADAIKTIQAANILQKGIENIGSVIPSVMEKAVPRAKARARVDKGTMRDSIDYEMTDQYTAKFWVGSDHGIFNEKGTEKMSAQPMIEPSATEAISELNTAIDSFVNGIINGNVNIPSKPTPSNKNKNIDTSNRFRKPVSGGRSSGSEASGRSSRTHKYISRTKVGNRWVYQYA